MLSASAEEEARQQVDGVQRLNVSIFKLHHRNLPFLCQGRESKSCEGQKEEVSSEVARPLLSRVHVGDCERHKR